MPNSYQVAKFSPLIAKAFNFSSSGDNTLVAGIAGATIRIMRLLLSSNAAVDVVFKDGASNSLSGPIHLTGTGGAIYLPPPPDDPHYVTTVTNDFIVNLSGAVQVGGTVWYFQS